MWDDHEHEITNINDEEGLGAVIDYIKEVFGNAKTYKIYNTTTTREHPELGDVETARLVAINQSKFCNAVILVGSDDETIAIFRNGEEYVKRSSRRDQIAPAGIPDCWIDINGDKLSVGTTNRETLEAAREHGGATTSTGDGFFIYRPIDEIFEGVGTDVNQGFHDIIMYIMENLSDKTLDSFYLM